jgi:hypothetical protein
MGGFRYARGHGRSGTSKDTRAICDRCGNFWKLYELKWESTGAKGSPEDRRSGLRVCPDCFDPVHPLSKRPIAIRALLPDAEAMYQPREDDYDFIIAYPVFYSLPGAIFKPNPLSLPQGFTGNIIGTGVFPGLSVSWIPAANITVNSITLISETRVSLNITISPTASGKTVLYVTMGDDNLSNMQSLGGLINVTPIGGQLFGEGDWGNIEFGGPVGFGG